MALVQTVDFFTPVVDDPYDFGRIAAANALSDVYAMGGEALTALAVCSFPKGTLPLEALRATLAGGMDVLREEGVLLLGGHTVKGPEFTYGLAVTGTVRPDRILTNAGARAGDVLVLTKPIGTGVLSTALKQGRLSVDDERRLVASMATTNRQAGRSCREVGVHALTDVTGFGLLGHALEMAQASSVTLEIEASTVPLLPGAREVALAGAIPGGLKANREWIADQVVVAIVDAVAVDLLCDPQTSGGLLAAVAPQQADGLIAACRDDGVLACRVGSVSAGKPGQVVVR